MSEVASVHPLEVWLSGPDNKEELNRSQLAAAIGCSPASVTMYINGDRDKPSRELMQRIYDVTGIDANMWYGLRL